MKVFTDPTEAQEYFSTVSDLAFVPTMGALHRGHGTLIESASREYSQVAISIFVNPLQFGKNEDFTKYPRTLEADLELAEAAGAQAAFIPDAIKFTTGIKTNVSVKGVSDNFEGTMRPGHFDGVATIVLKLFQVVQPKSAFFGLKDLQQCSVISTMVNDLNLPIKLRFIETVREPSGLAMSSRNKYLNEDQLAIAAHIHAELQSARAAIKISPNSVQVALESAKSNLQKVGMEVEYLELVDSSTMLKSDRLNPQARIVIAGKLFGVRLIDNIAIN